MKVVIAIDSFKGCLSSREVVQSAAKGVFMRWPDAEICQVPISDGGEGLTETVTEAMRGHFVDAGVHGPLMEPMTAQYGISADGTTAIIEMSVCCGLPLVPIGKRNPELTTTYGLGELISDAYRRGCRKFILGIGGSATNDAGMGMLQALGAVIKYRLTSHMADSLYSHQGSVIACGKLLSQIQSIDISPIEEYLGGCEFLVACDVQNPLSGPEGAACVFAPQKGADSAMVRRLDYGLSHLLQITSSATCPGDGAAGGLGFALRHFLHAKLTPGIELFLSLIDFDSKLQNADLIITGEGQCDRQTLMGKAPFGVLSHTRQVRKDQARVYALCGSVADTDILLDAGFDLVCSINNHDSRPLSVLMQPDVARQNIIDTIAHL